MDKQGKLGVAGEKKTCNVCEMFILELGGFPMPNRQ